MHVAIFEYRKYGAKKSDTCKGLLHSKLLKPCLTLAPQLLSWNAGLDFPMNFIKLFRTGNMKTFLCTVAFANDDDDCEEGYKRHEDNCVYNKCFRLTHSLCSEKSCPG
mmetsp:Transcript_3048/g.3789  ORF Transcript_3048/g.3789 Transcript_3048/m.3789 type:complete len:108 (+) Transcript_3048:171-494(+)